MSYPPVPSPPPTANVLSSQQRAALVRSAKKLGKVLGDVPRVLDSDMPASPLVPTESIWRRRKPTHLPPLLKPPTPSVDDANMPTSPVYHHSPTHCGSVLSVAPSILSNAPSTASGSSASDARTHANQRRTTLERLRHKLGNELPASAVFPTTPRTAVPTPRTPRASRAGHPSRTRTRSRSRSRSGARYPSQTDDARSVTFSVSSDESMHTVTLTTARVHSPRPHRSKHVYHTGPLPPVPSIPAHFASASSRAADDDDVGDVGLIRPRQKMAAGSMIGGSEFKAARRAKREGKTQSGMAEPGEVVEMVGFMRM